MNPVGVRFWIKCETYFSTYCFGQHWSVVLFIDYQSAKTVLFEKSRSYPAITKSSSTFPVIEFCYSCRITSIDDFFKAGDNVGFCMFSHFDHDPMAFHFMSDRTCSTGTSKAIQDDVAGISCEIKDALQ